MTTGNIIATGQRGMSPVIGPPPDLGRPDATVVMVSEWRVDSPEKQVAAVDAAMDAWDGIRWPAGLLSHNCYLGADGRTVMHLSQWTDEQAIDEFYRTDPPERIERFLRAVPSIERRTIARYRLYRRKQYAQVAAGDPVPVAVVPAFETRCVEHAMEWIDAMLAAAAAAHKVEPIDGLISSQYYISTDGTRALLYAEWSSEDANHLFRENRRVGNDVVDAFGVRRLGGQAFRFYRSRSGA